MRTGQSQKTCTRSPCRPVSELGIEPRYPSVPAQDSIKETTLLSATNAGIANNLIAQVTHHLGLQRQGTIIYPTKSQHFWQSYHKLTLPSLSAIPLPFPSLICCSTSCSLLCAPSPISCSACCFRFSAPCLISFSPFCFLLYLLLCHRSLLCPICCKPHTEAACDTCSIGYSTGWSPPIQSVLFGLEYAMLHNSHQMPVWTTW